MYLMVQSRHLPTLVQIFHYYYYFEKISILTHFYGRRNTQVSWEVKLRAFNFAEVTNPTMRRPWWPGLWLCWLNFWAPLWRPGLIMTCSRHSLGFRLIALKVVLNLGQLARYDLAQYNASTLSGDICIPLISYKKKKKKKNFQPHLKIKWPMQSNFTIPIWETPFIHLQINSLCPTLFIQLSQ